MILLTAIGAGARYLFKVDWPVPVGLLLGLIIAPAIPVGPT